MFIPDALWIPSEKDVRTSFAPIQAFRNSLVSDTATTVTLEFSDLVPEDQVFLVSGYFVAATPGAGQVAQFATVNVRDSGNTIATLSQFRPTDPADNFVINDRQGCWIPILANQSIRIQGFFDAGANANFVNGSIQGVRIPRGNWQRG